MVVHLQNVKAPLQTNRLKSRMLEDASLTSQEAAITSTAQFDLGPGYPITLPFDSSLLAKSRSITSPDPGASAFVSNCNLILDIPPNNAAFAALTGSVALQRAIAATRNIAERNGRPIGKVILSTPTIDIGPLMLRELPSLDIAYVTPNRATLIPDVDAIVRLAAFQNSPVSTLVLITSPENPTGYTWSRADLGRLMQACVDGGNYLVVDHAFALFGHAGERTPCVWDEDLPGCDWIGTWDTGKTWYEQGDKLGLLVSALRNSDTALQALNVLQLEVSSRTAELFAELTKPDHAELQVRRIARACESNRQTIKSLESTLGWTNIATNAGTFALIDIGRQSDTTVQAQLLRSGVGVVAAHSFFQPHQDVHTYLRLALARDPDYFESALDIAARVCARNSGE